MQRGKHRGLRVHCKRLLLLGRTPCTPMSAERAFYVSGVGNQRHFSCSPPVMARCFRSTREHVEKSSTWRRTSWRGRSDVFLPSLSSGPTNDNSSQTSQYRSQITFPCRPMAVHRLHTIHCSIATVFLSTNSEDTVFQVMSRRVFHTRTTGGTQSVTEQYAKHEWDSHADQHDCVHTFFKRILTVKKYLTEKTRARSWRSVERGRCISNHCATFQGQQCPHAAPFHQRCMEHLLHRNGFWTEPCLTTASIPRDISKRMGCTWAPTQQSSTICDSDTGWTFRISISRYFAKIMC